LPPMDSPDWRESCWIEVLSGWAGRSMARGAAWAHAATSESMAAAMGRIGEMKREKGMAGSSQEMQMCSPVLDGTAPETTQKILQSDPKNLRTVDLTRSSAA